MSDFKAYLFRDHLDWAMSTVRLFVVDQSAPGHPRYLRADGAWQEPVEGTADPEAGIALPAESVEALAVAIQEFQGHASHADTEARVLREWLAVEQRRVDEALKR